MQHLGFNDQVITKPADDLRGRLRAALDDDSPRIASAGHPDASDLPNLLLGRATTWLDALPEGDNVGRQSTLPFLASRYYTQSRHPATLRIRPVGPRRALPPPKSAAPRRFAGHFAEAPGMQNLRQQGGQRAANDGARHGGAVHRPVERDRTMAVGHGCQDTHAGATQSMASP